LIDVINIEEIVIEVYEDMDMTFNSDLQSEDIDLDEEMNVNISMMNTRKRNNKIDNRLNISDDKMQTN